MRSVLKSLALVPLLFVSAGAASAMQGPDGSRKRHYVPRFLRTG